MPPSPSGPRLTTTGRPASEASHQHYLVRLFAGHARKWPATPAVEALRADLAAVVDELDDELNWAPGPGDAT